MKTYATMFCAMLAMGALTVSCSSEDEAVSQGASGQASIMIDLSVMSLYLKIHFIRSWN